MVLIIKLSSDLGDFFVYIVYAMSIAIISTFLYSLFTFYFPGILASLLLSGIWYFGFGKNIIRFKNIKFDDEFLYIDKKNKIELEKVLKVHDGIIVYQIDNNSYYIYYNFYFIHYKNISLLKENIKKCKSQSR